MNVIVVLSLMAPVALVFSASHSSEHTESDIMHFYYDPDMHYFIASTSATCFMAKLTRDEQDHVHTTKGIEDLEIMAPVALVFSASHTSEHTETDSMHFYYDPDMHYFIASTSATCFMAKLTRDEQDHVHTTKGIEDLELTMLRDWLGKLPETKIYHDDRRLPSIIQRWCGNKDIFLLERNITTPMSTVQSPLATLISNGSATAG